MFQSIINGDVDQRSLIKSREPNFNRVPGRLVHSTPLRRSTRDELASNRPRVYEKKCIFCLRISKYIKGARTRQALIPATELQADAKVREVAILQNNEQLLVVTSRDTIVAEAHHHTSCNSDYTRSKKSKIHRPEEDNKYQT